MPGCRHAAVRMPNARQRHDQITPATLRQELDRRMARAKPHLDAVSQGHPLRPAPRPIDTDRAGILLSDVPGLVEAWEVHGGSLEEQVLWVGDEVWGGGYGSKRHPLTLPSGTVPITRAFPPQEALRSGRCPELPVSAAIPLSALPRPEIPVTPHPSRRRKITSPTPSGFRPAMKPHSSKPIARCQACGSASSAVAELEQHVCTARPRAVGGKRHQRAADPSPACRFPHPH